MMSYSQLDNQMIISYAERLGANRIPVEEIKRAYSYVMVGPGWGCLNTDDGKKLFIAYRLRELGCFDVGCQSDEEFGTGCILHFFDMFAFTYQEWIKRSQLCTQTMKIWTMIMQQEAVFALEPLG